MGRRAVDRGLRVLRLEESILAYQKGQTTAWAEARNAKVTLMEFLDALRERGMGLRTDESDILRELQSGGMKPDGAVRR